MKFLSKIVGVLAGLSYLIILLVFIVVAPMVAGYRTVVVLTGSMEPTYGVGSVIYYKAQSFESINEGDVITFSVTDDSKSVVTHRVASKDTANRSFMTKGDANSTGDTNPISYSNVKGKVLTYHLPYAGYFVQYIQNIWFIVPMVLILMAKVGMNYWEESQKKEEELV